MNRLPRLSALALVPALFIWLGSTPPASAANAVFLSNDVAESEVTYVVQIQSFVARHVAKVRILLPPDTDSAHAALGRITIGSTSITGSVALLSPDALLVDLGGARNIAAATPIRVELFNLKNPPAGDHQLQVSTLDLHNHILETFPPIAFASFAGSSSDITAVLAGPGLTGGATSGDATLSVDTAVIQQRISGVCAAGNAIRVINQDGTVSCAGVAGAGGGTVTSVGTGAGLTGGPITTTGTVAVAPGGITTGLLADGSVATSKLPDGAVTGAKLGANSVDSSKIVDGSVGSADVNAGQIQLRVSGTCAAGNAIRVVNQDGTVSCQSLGSSGGVANVTASAPLQSSGGSTPAISLPNVIIGVNTAIGLNALSRNTAGTDNTASGAGALASNTGGVQQHRHREWRSLPEHARLQQYGFRDRHSCGEHARQQ